MDKRTGLRRSAGSLPRRHEHREDLHANAPLAEARQIDMPLGRALGEGPLACLNVQDGVAVQIDDERRHGGLLSHHRRQRGGQ